MHFPYSPKTKNLRLLSEGFNYFNVAVPPSNIPLLNQIVALHIA
jgi:hypothetical protein